MPARSLALVVLAAGVATAAPELTLDAVTEFTPVRLADALLSLSDMAEAHR